MDQKDDSRLIALAGAGDQEAFTELVRRYRDAVYGYCYYRTGNFEDARDLCQETFILAYRKLAQLRSEDRFGAWLRRIAANLCTRWSQERRETPVEEVLPETPVPESPKAAFVREALSSLPDKERLAVVMHYVDGLSYSEIAGFLETSAGAVKGKLYRGREMLKKEVLKMTQEAFGANKLDEEFVLKAVRAALDESQKACWETKDTQLAKRKAEEAIEMLDRLGSPSQEADEAKFEALMRRVHATLDLNEREALIERAYDFGAQSADPMVASEVLRARAERLIQKRKMTAAQELLQRAREVATEGKLSHEVALCDAAEADIAFLRDDLEEAGTLLRRAIDGLRQAGPPVDWPVPMLEAGIVALDSLPESIVRGDVLLLYYNAGHFWVEDDRILLDVYLGSGLLTTAGFAVSPRLPVLSNALPPFDLGWPEPDQILTLPPKVGRSWSTETRELNVWYRIDSMIESDDESVVTRLGEFDRCLKLVKRLSGPKRQGADLERQIFGTRTIWLAPEVGIVKTVHEPEDGETVTAELVDYQIAGGTGYLPLDVGNWWRYRWVEGEEDYGFLTNAYMGIAAREPDGRLLMQRYITCVRN